MPTFEKATDDVDVLVGKVMEKFHGPLHEAGVTIDILMASPTTNKNGESSGPPLKHNGFPCLAIISIVQLPQRVAGMADVLLKIDAEQWKDMKESQRAALIDHELEHLVVKKDKDGATVTDDLDRPRLRIKAHDREVGWFNDCVRRNGKDAIEFQQFNNIWQTARQLELPFVNVA